MLLFVSCVFIVLLLLDGNKFCDIEFVAKMHK